jgi:hypothetical protein
MSRHRSKRHTYALEKRSPRCLPAAPVAYNWVFTRLHGHPVADEHSRADSDPCPETQAAQQIDPPRRGTDQPGRRAPVRALLRRFVEEEVSYLSALQSDPVTQILADP